MSFRKKLYTLIPAFLIVSTCFGQDTILLTNGDVLTGRVLSQNADSVYFKSSAFGSVSLQIEDIAEIKIKTEELGEVIVPSGALTGGTPEPEAPASSTSLANPITNPQGELEDAEKSKWSGQAGLSIAMRESTSSDTSGVTTTDSYETYRAYGNTNWQADRNKLHWDWTYRYSRDEVKKRDDFLNVTQQYSHDFNADYYTTAKTMYQRDYRRKIENEYLQTAELGVKWFDHPAFQFSTSVGGGYHMYKRTTYDSSTGMNEELNIDQPKFIFDQSLRWQMIQSLTLIQKYTHLGDLTNYHLVFSAGLENKLIRELFLRLEYQIDRDTEVFYNDKGYYDKALLTSLLYKF